MPKACIIAILGIKTYVTKGFLQLRKATEKPSTMRHLYLSLLCSFLVTHLTFAQPFTEVLPPKTIDGVTEGQALFLDVDNDGDMDLLFNGLLTETQLYINDGTGQLTEDTEIPFTDVIWGSIAHADVDGDDDQDIFISGQAGGASRVSELYINDGVGGFSKSAENTFKGVAGSSVFFGDIDQDGDQDLLVSGKDTLNNYSNLVYENDGNGVFSPLSTSFESMESWAVALCDIDNDNNLDVLISNSQGSALFTNDGTGQFNEDSMALFPGILYSRLAFSDLDNDGDVDFLISGTNSEGDKESRLYTNTGSGQFEVLQNSPFEDWRAYSATFFDADGDGDLDLLIGGINGASESVTTLFLYEENEGFTEMPAIGKGADILATADITGDSTIDVFIGGNGSETGDLEPFSDLFTNDGTGQLTIIPPSLFEQAGSNAMEFADFDGDGDKDLMLTGCEGASVAGIYLNDGTGHFSLQADMPLSGICNGDLKVSDFDMDGDQDVFLIGNISGQTSVAKMYINDGSGNFGELSDTPFTGLAYSTVTSSDVDGDGDEDMLITGENSLYLPVTIFYRNVGGGSYTEITDVPFEGVDRGDAQFFDIDNDGDQDLLISGRTSLAIDGRISKLYKNDGAGHFTLLDNTPFAPVYQSAMDFSDIDNDGDQDLLIAGTNADYPFGISKLYRNDGTGHFTEVQDTPFKGVKSGSVVFADVDNDGDEDLLLTGTYGLPPNPTTDLYLNDGMGNFEEYPYPPFEDVNYGVAKAADIDGDGDLDVMVTGLNMSGKPISKLYINNSSPTGTSEKTDTAIDFLLFPNPALSGKVTLAFKGGGTEQAMVNMLDLQGRLLRQYRVPDGSAPREAMLNLDGLPAGVYLIQLIAGGKAGVQKLVKW